MHSVPNCIRKIFREFICNFIDRFLLNKYISEGDFTIYAVCVNAILLCALCIVCQYELTRPGPARLPSLD